MDTNNLIKLLPNIGQILLDRDRLILVRAAGIYQIRQEFIEQVGTERGIKLMGRIGFLWGIDDAISYRENLDITDGKQLLETGLRLLAERGMGKFELYEESGSWDDESLELIVRASGAVEAMFIMAREGLQRSPVCVLSSAYLTGLVSSICGRNMVSIEKQCIASGAPFCEFHIKSAKAWEKEALSEAESIFYINIGQELQTLEDDLKSKEQLLNIILDSIEEGVILENENFEVEFMNKAMKDLFGDFVGRKCYEMLGRDEPCDGPCGVKEIIHNGKKRFYYRDTDQFGRTFDVYASELIKPNGERVVLEVSRDITEKLKREEEAARRQEELVRFNRIAIDRELRMIELKQEVNELLERLGEEPKYKIPSEDWEAEPE